MQPLSQNAKIGIGVAAVAVGLLGWAYLAKAEGIDRARSSSHEAVSAEPWTGPSIGIGVGWNVGTVGGVGPVGMSSEGGVINGSLGYDKQFGRIVVGGEVGYSHVFGDLETFVTADMYGLGRLGVLVSNTALLYGHVGLGRLDTIAGDVNGWRVGPGLEVKIADSPFTFDMRYSYGIHDVDDILGPVAEARTHELMARIKFKPIWK